MERRIIDANFKLGAELGERSESSEAPLTNNVFGSSKT